MNALDSMENEYKLPNRDGYDVYLKKEGDHYKLIHPIHLFSCTLSELENEYQAVDPPGGPYISVGYQVHNNLFVERITADLKFYLTYGKSNTK